MENKFLAKWYINYLDNKQSGSTIDRISMTLFNSKITGIGKSFLEES